MYRRQSVAAYVVVVVIVAIPSGIVFGLRRMRDFGLFPSENTEVSLKEGKDIAHN